MNGVINMTRFLLDSPLDERQKRYAEMLKSSGDTLLKVVNNVLDYSKIDAGKLSSEAIRFDPRDLMERTLEPFRILAAGNGLGFEESIDPLLPETLSGDALKFSQIVSNLMGNAIKFTERGKVTIRVGARRRGETEIDLKLVIADTGIGISAARQESLFKPFEQIDPSMARRFGGTGLGLAIVKELCDIMGGSISVVSTEDRGSEFTVVLPFPVAQRDTGRAASSVRKWSFVNTRVLVVEDQEMNSEIAVEFLASMGVDTAVAKNGEEALAMLEKQSFDLVLMDLQMPLMDGFEATRRIRASSGDAIRKLPIIALTGFAMQEDRRASLNAGMNAHIHKPLDPLVLSETLAAWLPPCKVMERTWKQRAAVLKKEAPIEPARLAACLSALRSPIEDSEPAACMEAAAALRKAAWPDWASTDLMALLAMIDNFDFAHAGPALSALIKAAENRV